MRDLLSRLAIAAASLMLAGMGFVTAGAFLCYAVYLQLATMMEPPLAALLTAVAILFFCMVVVLIARLMMRTPGTRRRRARADFLSGGGDPAMEMGRRIGEEAHAFVKGHKRSTLLASLLAGFAIGASPKLRAYLRDLLGL